MRRLSTRRLLLLVGVCALLSLVLPWWFLKMHSPQYPDGLKVTVGLFSVSGDVGEVDDLNHYIGFRPLATIAAVERKAAWFAIPAALLPLLAAAFAWRRRWAWLSTVPVIVIPVFFVADMGFWMWYAGNHLDPHAALSSSVSPWTPNMLGPGGVGQFHTFGMFDWGFFLAAAAAAGGVALAIRALRPGEESAIVVHARPSVV